MYSTSKLAQVTVHSKESTQLDVYIFRKMGRNHGIKNIIGLPSTTCIVPKNSLPHLEGTVKLGNKERFDKEQIGIKQPFPVTNLPFTS